MVSGIDPTLPHPPSPIGAAAHPPATGLVRARRPVSAYVALAAGAALVAPTIVRPGAGGPVLCPFRRLTGVWCPGCGLTRSAGWLAHGDLAESLRYHPWGPLIALQLALAGAWWFWARHRRSAAPVVNAAAVSMILVVNTVALALVWLLRLKIGAFDDLA